MTVPIIEPVTIDASQWNCLNIDDHPDETGIDFALLASKAERVIVRLAVGLQEDLRARQIVEGLRPHILAGEVELDFYHGVIEWLDPLTQAVFFAELVEEIAGDLPYGFVMADFERDSSGYSQQTLAARYNNYLLGLAAELEISLFSIVIYTAMWFWDPNIGAVMQSFFSKFRLIFAHYTLNFSYLLIPSSWKNTEAPWWKHQFSADGNGMAATFGFPGNAIDMSRDNPDLQPPPPPPPAPAVLFRVRCVQQVSLRQAAGVGGKFIRSIKVGEVFDVVAVVRVGPRLTDIWIQFPDLTWAAWVYYDSTTVFFGVA